MEETKQEEILNRVFKHKNAGELFIRRVPVETLKRFKEFSNDEFCGDYGMALKQLLDFTLVFGPTIEGIQTVLSDLDNRIEHLETKGAQPKARVKTMSGREIGGKR